MLVPQPAALLLITDVTHAVPVRISRNGIRLVQMVRVQLIV